MFGCVHEHDELSHYVMCPKLYFVLLQLRPSTTSNPVERIGLHNPSKDSLLVTACVFSAYHACRRDLRGISLPEAGLFTSAQLERIRDVFCRGFKAEADEVSLVCRPPHVLNVDAIDEEPA